jgi:small subunit ribosomal protein S9
MMADDELDTPAETPGDEQPVTPAETPEAPVASEDGGDPVAAEEPSPQELGEAAEEVVEEIAEEVVAEEIVAEEIVEEIVAEEAAVEIVAEEIVEEEEASAAALEDGEEAEEPAVRVKPAVPGAHLEVDIVPEGVDPLGRSEEYVDPYAIEDDEVAGDGEGDEEEREEGLTEPIATAAIDLAAGARYRATGKRKTAIARVTLRPGSGTYLVNGRTLEEHFPRGTLQRNIRQPLETVGYQERMDVVARLHGGGISAQAGALRHGVSRALLEADPNLRGELKRRGFLTRDSRAKERKKAGLKKARKRPQFSKR